MSAAKKRTHKPDAPAATRGATRAAETTAPREGGTRRVMLVVVFVLLGVFGLVHGFREIASPDIGFHLATARYILENGAFPASDPFTYTVSDRPYIDLQWIFQIVMHAAHAGGGAFGIIALTIVLTLAFAALLVLRSRQRLGFIPYSSTVLLLTFLLGNLWEPRPHLFSWILGSILLLVLEAHARGTSRWLFALPVIMVVWVNAHSLFVLGLVIVAAYAGSHLLQALTSGRLGRGEVDRKLLAWCAAALPACLVNPYHIHGVLFPLVQFRDLSGEGGFKSPLTGIAEFNSPFGFEQLFVDGHLSLMHPRLFWQAFAVLALVGLIAHAKRTRLFEWILLGGFFYVFLKANKNFGYFVMVAFPIAAMGLDLVAAGIRDRVMRWFGRGEALRERLTIACLAGCALVSLVLIGAGWSGRLLALAWDPAERAAGFANGVLPVGACAFINEKGLQGRMLNTWDHGGYIAWSTKQPVLIYSHGEVTGPKFFDEYVKAKEPQGFPAALERWDPKIAVVPYRVAPFWLYHLDASPAWRMAYADEYAAVFVHDSLAAGLPSVPKPRAGVDYVPIDANAAVAIIEQAVRAPEPSIADRLRGRSALPLREINLSSFYLHTQEIDACIATSLEGLRKTPFVVPELLLNLGHVLNFRRQYQLADACFDAFLRADDDPVIAAEIAQVRRSRRR